MVNINISISRFFRQVLSGVLLGVCSSGFAAFNSADLRCEYQVNPLGIDVVNPRLSWKLSSEERGQKQTAYRVLVARSLDALNEGKADLWDSGKVESSQSVLVPYAGKKLKAFDACYWKLMVWGAAGSPSEWSHPARFSMGPLSKSDWTGQWIGLPSAKPEQHIWFRQTLQLDHAPENVCCYVATIGYHELYINGKRVGDTLLAPTLTRLDKRVQYVTYDVSSLLQEGENSIAVWQGPGWSRYSFFNTSPALLLQLHGSDIAGNQISLSSDASWKCETSHSANLGGCKYRDNGGEVVDMRQANPAWNLPTVSTEGWDNAKGIEKEVTLSAQMSPPNRVIKTLLPVRIEGVNPCKIDMGVNYTGMLDLNLPPGAAEGEVRIKVADDPVGEKAGKDFGQLNILKCNPDGSGHFQNRFNYVAGRYITIEGLKRPLKKEELTVRAMGTDLNRMGRFECSNELFNKIYETDLWTFRANNIEGVLMDCPHRERLGYGEVSYATAWGIGIPNYDSGAFYTKVIRDGCDVQEENGWIHHTAPQINTHYGGPMWSSAPINVAWEQYKQFADTRAIEVVYPTGQRWLGFLSKHMKDGLLENYSTHKGKFLGDWAAPGGRKEWGDTAEALYFNNCTYLMVLQKMERFATLLGKSSDAKRYEDQVEELKKAIHARFYNADTRSYVNGTQTQLAYALWTGVPPEHPRAGVYENFVASMKKEPVHLDMGSSGLPVLLSYCIEDAECNDLLFPALTSMERPSYGYFIARGETTWPEYWSVDVPSKIHTCYTGIASWFIRGLAGIRQDVENPGMQHFIIKPHPVSDLMYVAAESPSPYGTIKSAWKKTGSGFELKISIPVNSTATVFVPALNNQRVTENGIKIDQAKGVRFLRREDEYVVLGVSSGTYRFGARNK